MENNNIYQRLLEVKRNVSSLVKDDTNAHFNYDFVSSNQVLSSIRDSMNEQGILLIPEITETEQCAQGVRLKMKYCFVNTDNPNDKITVDWFAFSPDKQEQALGKALTYSEKYFILKFFNIPTNGDDPDKTNKPEVQINEKEKQPKNKQRNTTFNFSNLTVKDPKGLLYQLNLAGRKYKELNIDELNRVNDFYPNELLANYINDRLANQEIEKQHENLPVNTKDDPSDEPYGQI